MRIPPAAASLLLLAGCAGNVEPLPASFAIRDRTIWAGSNIVVESEAFVGLERAPRLRMGSEWLPVERVGDDAFAGRVPSTASGTYAVDIVMDGDPEPLPPVEVAGMTVARQYTTQFPAHLQVLPGSGHATIMGGTLRPGNSSTYTFSFFDLATGTERPLSHPLYDHRGLRGPGASYRPGVYFGHTSVEPEIAAFRLDGTGATPLGEPPIDLAEMIMEVGPGRYVRGTGNRVEAPGWSSGFGITDGPVMSHAAGRATFRADYTSNVGLPVFSMPDGELAYLLADVVNPAGVEFSPDGELLAVAEAEYGAPP